MTESAARRAVLRVLRGVPTTDAREQRNMAERHQAMRFEAWGILSRAGQSEQMKLQALDRLIKIENQHAELFGLKKLIVKVHDDGSAALPIEWARNLLERYHETLENQKETIIERPAERIEESSAEPAEDAATAPTDAETADDESDAIEVLPGEPLDFTKNGKVE
jgi:hypothetical protein